MTKTDILQAISQNLIHLCMAFKLCLIGLLLCINGRIRNIRLKMRGNFRISYALLTRFNLIKGKLKHGDEKDTLVTNCSAKK
jgi:hypothetical protein